MSENKQEARCIHCGRPMSKHPHVGVDPCPTARQANQPQGKAQPEQPGINLARWIWQRFSGIPITEPYDGEFRLLLLKIASYTDELKQRQSFADFHAESKEPSLTYTLDQLNAKRGQQATAEKAAQEFEVKARVAIAGRFAQREPHYDAWSEPMRIVREVLAELGAAPPQGEAEKEGRK